MTRKIGIASTALLTVAVLLIYAVGEKGKLPPASNVAARSDNPAVEKPAVTTLAGPAKPTSTSAQTVADTPVETKQSAEPVFRQNPFDATPEERMASVRRSIEQKYGKTIRALRLSSSDEQKLRQLLADRSEAAYVAHEVISSGERKAGDLRAAIDEAQAEIEKDIQTIFDADTARKIKLMLMASDYLNRVNQSISRALADAGEPLTNEQVLPLAVIMMETYGSLNNPTTRPSVANVDPQSYLTPEDELVLARAATLLTSRQITALRQLVGEQNKAVLSRPVHS